MRGRSTSYARDRAASGTVSEVGGGELSLHPKAAYGKAVMKTRITNIEKALERILFL
jgi:hypothetical protein